MNHKTILCCIFILLNLGCKEKSTCIDSLRPVDIVSIKQGKEFCIAKVLDYNITNSDSSITIFLYKNHFIPQDMCDHAYRG